MNRNGSSLSRRALLQALCTTTAALNLSPRLLFAETLEKIIRHIPGTREPLAIIGVGSSLTFDIDSGAINRSQLIPVMQTFFDGGGQVIDTSPMYGNAETVIGKLLGAVTGMEKPFLATKVWTFGKADGIRQMRRSMQRMGVRVMDLMQIHNLRDWKVHIATLRDWKQQGKIRYTGITTSHGMNHEELEMILKTEALDFVQFSYNIENRVAEQRLLPIAKDKGIATLINRPFQRGYLFRKIKGKPLPGWTSEFDCNSWGQFFLKFVASHPDVTCIIPATSKLKHMIDNMAAGFGRLPDAGMRQRMLQYMASL
ncbi:MAG: aldo/keto reductase [Gammaproteobacteria bacterium]